MAALPPNMAVSLRLTVSGLVYFGGSASDHPRRSLAENSRAGEPKALRYVRRPSRGRTLITAYAFSAIFNKTTLNHRSHSHLSGTARAFRIASCAFRRSAHLRRTAYQL